MNPFIFITKARKTRNTRNIRNTRNTRNTRKPETQVKPEALLPMQVLNLPPYAAKVTCRDGKRMIFDKLRRKYVSLTPEEWVRQHFVNYLTVHMGYPSSMLANEVELSIGQKRLRCDSVLYGLRAEPRMIIEYKAPTISLTQKVFDQISVYNLLLHVDYLIVSNGLLHYCCKMDYDNQKYLFLEGIPSYENI